MSYYQESGKYNLLRTVLIFIVMCGLVGLIGYGYAVLTHINPFIYVNFLITIGYVALVFICILGMFNVGQMRNSRVRLITSILLSGFGLFATWVGYISYMFEESFMYAIENFFWCIDRLSDQSFSIGRLGRGGLPIEGAFLYAFWILEAAIIFFIPVYAPIKFGGGREVFCEQCSKWADDKQFVWKERKEMLTKDDIEKLIRENKLSQLWEWEDAKEGDALYYEFMITACDKCHGAYYLSVDLVTNKPNDKGELEKDQNTIFPYHEISLNQVPRDIMRSGELGEG